MADDSHDDVGRHAKIKEQGHAAVPEIMEAHVLQPGARRSGYQLRRMLSCSIGVPVVVVKTRPQPGVPAARSSLAWRARWARRARTQTSGNGTGRTDDSDLVGTSCSSPLTRCKLCLTSNTALSRSTWRQGRPSSSARRIPRYRARTYSACSRSDSASSSSFFDCSTVSAAFDDGAFAGCGQVILDLRQAQSPCQKAIFVHPRPRQADKIVKSPVNAIQDRRISFRSKWGATSCRVRFARRADDEASATADVSAGPRVDRDSVAPLTR